MLRCEKCLGWVPGTQACPNCALGNATQKHTKARVSRWLKRLGAAVGSGALGMTLAACYGAPCATGEGGYDCSEDYVHEVRETCEDRGLATDPNGHCQEPLKTEAEQQKQQEQQAQRGGATRAMLEDGILAPQRRF